MAIAGRAMIVGRMIEGLAVIDAWTEIAKPTAARTSDGKATAETPDRDGLFFDCS